jgi:hypothetical protein
MPKWTVHTPRLLAEVLENPTCYMLEKPLNIFGKLLASVAERAIELDDPQMNELMLRLTLYSQADPYDPEYNRDVMSLVQSDTFVTRPQEECIQ